MAGRFAPTPTSTLHLGNLRTALGAWLMARSSGREFRLRVEDLDPARSAAAPGVAKSQLLDLGRLGLTFDGPILWQSQRTAAYETALAELGDQVYECYCSRREIAEAAQAPHGADGSRPYPGTCRDLSPGERVELRRHRPPALRVRAEAAEVAFTDLVAGPQSSVVDDFVVRRGDGVFAYNFAVVVDDAAQGVDQVVRGDDLLSSTPRQIWLGRRLGWATPDYAHLPLAIGPDGQRLAKRDRAVGLDRVLAAGWTGGQVLAGLAHSLGVEVAGWTATAADLVERFNLDRVPRSEWIVDPGVWTRPPGF
jgi:glutamyl-tRNA synthetase